MDKDNKERETKTARQAEKINTKQVYSSDLVRERTDSISGERTSTLGFVLCVRSHMYIRS